MSEPEKVGLWNPTRVRVRVWHFLTHTDPVNDAVELVTLSIYLILLLYHSSYPMNNPAITNLVISLGGMQGM